MSYIGKVELMLMAIALSGIGIIDMVNRWQNGKAYRELRKLENPSKMTTKLLDECEKFLEPLWWHWVFVVVFIFSILGLAIDTD